MHPHQQGDCVCCLRDTLLAPVGRFSLSFFLSLSLSHSPLSRNLSHTSLTQPLSLIPLSQHLIVAGVDGGFDFVHIASGKPTRFIHG